MRAPVLPGRFAEAAELDVLPRIAPEEEFPAVCAGCGDCCRARRDILLSGLDLYRLARRLRLPPRTVAEAFCRETPGTLPGLLLMPSRHSGNCPFLDGGACAVHEARPLACALYPLGQAIDLETFRTEYYIQPPLCGVQVPGRTLRDYLEDSGVLERAGTDAFWARSCAALQQRLEAAQHYPKAAVRGCLLRALYYDYDFRDDFQPQFTANLARLDPLLARLLGENAQP